MIFKNAYFFICLYNKNLENIIKQGFLVEKLGDFAIIKQDVHSEIRHNFVELRGMIKEFGINESLVICSHEEMTVFDKAIFYSSNSKREELKKIEDGLKRINFDLNLSEDLIKII